MSHPAVVACHLAIEQAEIQSAMIDNRLARSEAADVRVIVTSHKAIARSRDMLARIANRSSA